MLRTLEVKGSRTASSRGNSQPSSPGPRCGAYLLYLLLEFFQLARGLEHPWTVERGLFHPLYMYILS